MSGNQVDTGDGATGAAIESGIALSRELIRGVIDRPGYAFTDGELLANVRALYELSAVMDAAKLAFVAELQTRPEAVPGARAGRVAVTFLTEALLVSGPQANRDVTAATALAGAAPELPRMGQALIEGEVSRDHVDVAVSTLRRLPKALKNKLITQPATDPGTDPGTTGPTPEPLPRRTGADVIDEVLTAQARLLPPSTVDRLGRQIVARLDPDRAERFTADAFERRSCTFGTDFAGMGVYKVILDAATHLQVRALIARCSAPRPVGAATSESGEVITVKDTRTSTQRQADAITDLILAGGLALGADQPTGDDATDTPSPVEIPSDLDDPADADQPTSDDTHKPQHTQNPQHTQHTQDPQDPEHTETAAGTQNPSSTQNPNSTQTPGSTQNPGSSETPGSTQTPGCGERAGGLPPGVFMARPVAAAELSVVTTLNEILAAFGAADPTMQGAGLARVTLAGNIGTYPGATLDRYLLARLACDSPLYRVVTDDQGAILHHGRRRRFASKPQRRALAVRDGGCVIPGCHAPPEWCEAHHVIPWTHGGRTDIDAMALLCARHHTAHHAGVYHLQMRDGIPWVRLPAWQDITRPWLRNHTHNHHHLASTTARTITGPPPAPTWTTDKTTDHAA